jgi:hypothetical protein
VITDSTTTRRGRLWPAALWALAALVLASATSASAQTVTYGTWKLTVTPDSAARAQGRDVFTEYVLIEEDGVTAHEMSRLGFGTIIPSTSTGPGGSINFVVNLNSRHHGTCRWTGNLTTSTMTGTLQWTRDGKTYNYTFTGSPYTPPEAES